MKSNNIYNFYTQIYRDNKERIIGKRKLSSDIVQYLLNKILRPVELHLVNKYYSEVYPVIFIVGSPRSGTTFLSQFIASNFDIAFINNQIAKYWLAPLLASRYIQNIKKDKNLQFESNLGSSHSVHSPHEFGYFWQYWMDHRNTDDLEENELAAIPWPKIKQELYSLSNYHKKCLLIKNLNYINYKIDRISKEFPNSIFIYIQREPIYVIQSIYESRLKRYGDEKIWWSIRPKEVNNILKLEPIEQIAQQVSDVESKISNSLNGISSQRYHKMSYEGLISDPYNSRNRLSTFLKITPIIKEIRDLSLITNGNVKRLNDELFDKIETVVAMNNNKTKR